PPATHRGRAFVGNQQSTGTCPGRTGRRAGLHAGLDTSRQPERGPAVENSEQTIAHVEIHVGGDERPLFERLRLQEKLSGQGSGPQTVDVRLPYISGFAETPDEPERHRLQQLLIAGHVDWQSGAALVLQRPGTPST